RGQGRRERVRRIRVPPDSKRQARDWRALVRLLHEPAPDLDRQVAPRNLLGRAVVVIAEPDGGDQIARVADEPGLAPILAGAGLAGRLPAGQFGLAGGAGKERLL